MKSKFTVVAGFLLFAALSFGAPNDAEAVWATATINQVGQDYGRSILILTDTGGVFTEKWFILNPNNNKEMLAVALTAQALGKDIVIEIDDQRTNMINRVRVVNQ